MDRDEGHSLLIVAGFHVFKKAVLLFGSGNLITVRDYSDLGLKYELTDVVA